MDGAPAQPPSSPPPPSSCEAGMVLHVNEEGAPRTKQQQLAFRRKSIHVHKVGPTAENATPASSNDLLGEEDESEGARVPMVPLPNVRSVSAGRERDKLIIRKLQQCERHFSLHLDLHGEQAGKEIKRLNLIELNEIIHAPPAYGGPTISRNVLSAVIRTVEANICRDLSPATPPGAPEFDPEEDYYFDPQWQHLQQVYALLGKVLDSDFMRAPFLQDCITRSFVRKLLRLFSSYDRRERDSLKNVMHRLYATMIPYRAFIRGQLNLMYLRHIHDRPHGTIQGIGEMLEISGSIISGFVLPIKAEHVTFLHKVLMPLHGTPEIETYHPQLAYCVLQFVSKTTAEIMRGTGGAGPAVPRRDSSPTFAIVLNGMLRYWPKCNTSKEVMMMNELEEIIDALTVDGFSLNRMPIMQRLARCIKSLHFQVVERALILLENEKVLASLPEFADSLFLPVLREQVTNHWSRHVRERIATCIKYLEQSPGQSPGEEAPAIEIDGDVVMSPSSSSLSSSSSSSSSVGAATALLPLESSDMSSGGSTSVDDGKPPHLAGVAAASSGDDDGVGPEELSPDVDAPKDAAPLRPTKRPHTDDFDGDGTNGNGEAGLHHSGMHKGGELDDTPPNHLATPAFGECASERSLGDGMSERARKWLRLEQMAASNPLSQAS